MDLVVQGAAVDRVKVDLLVLVRTGVFYQLISAILNIGLPLVLPLVAADFNLPLGGHLVPLLVLLIVIWGDN